ncbi:MAG: PAS domain-containing sensor histidine kinase, partial [Ginsengibacter sp.]
KALNTIAARYGKIIAKNEIQIGDQFFDVIRHDKNSLFKDYASKVVKGKTVHYERVYQLGTGDILWIDFSINPVIEDGRVTGICITGRDITEKKKNEQERDFDRNNLAALINNTKDLMWSVNKDFKLITYNNSFNEVVKKLSGGSVTKGNNILKTTFEREQSGGFKKYYERAFKGESFTEIYNTSDKWNEISFYPIYDKRKIVGTACFSRDITERKKADAALETTLKELSDYKVALDESSIVSITNPKGIITYVNNNFCNVSKYSSGELLGKNHRIVNSSFHDKDFIKKLWTTILRGKIWRNEMRNKSKDGQVYWIDATIVPFLDDKKKPIQFVAINKDITEKKLIEQELVSQKVQEQKRITRAMIAAQEKERNHLGEELHDNINQILAGTKLYLGMVGNDNPAFKELIKYPIELIDSSIEEIRSLCHKLVTPLKNINLDKMVRTLLDNFSQSTSIKTGFKYSLAPQLLNDDLKLNIFRIIQEQINNTSKYAKAKSVTVSIIEKDRVLAISIKDDGIGFNLNTERKGIGITNMID